jgi:hypothetical protein
VQVLRGHAHEQRGLVDELFRDEPRVRVDSLAHRVPAHVLDTARDRDVGGTERHLAGHRGHRGHRARAHPVDRVPGHGHRQAREDGGAAADRQPLVADLRGGRDGDLADPVVRRPGCAAKRGFLITRITRSSALVSA